MLSDLHRVLSEAAGQEVRLKVPRHPSQGHLTTPLALHRPQPMAVATALAQAAALLPQVERALAVAPGFVNIFLIQETFGERVAELLAGAPPQGTSWAHERRASAVKMATSRGLWPLDWRPDCVHRLRLELERLMLARLLVPDRSLEKLFHDYYCHVPVLCMDDRLATARLGLMEATLRAMDQQKS